MSARFVYVDGQVKVCESGDLPWAAGREVSARLTLSRGTVVAGWTYPPAASLAGPVSSRRRAFIRRVDATRLREHRRTRAVRHRAARRYLGRPHAGERLARV